MGSVGAGRGGAAGKMDVDSLKNAGGGEVNIFTYCIRVH
jgi:hypothetical protein